MITPEEIKKYLPQYLSSTSEKELFDQINSDGIGDNYYAFEAPLKDKILQGDGLAAMQVINLPDPTVKEAPAIVLSNTCDMDLDNKRAFPSQMVYAPILNLEKYEKGLLARKVDSEQSIKSFVDAIRRQRVTQVLYLPQGAGLKYEGIVFLDHLNHFPAMKWTSDDVKGNRLFTLSNYGFYTLLIKISIHFTRIKEGIDRGPALSEVVAN